MFRKQRFQMIDDILGVAAEIGVPATLWLIVLLFIPYWRNRRRDVVVVCAALFQPMAHIFGMQITFFLPWLLPPAL